MTHKICDACETVQHCSKHGCIPLTQIIAAEGYHEAFAARRNRPQPKQLTQEEVLHELWFLRRRVRQVEQQLLQATPYDPAPDVKELAKWLNEEPNRNLNRQALARILAYLT